MLKIGCIQIYTGNGKGKTTAALGCALRMLACGGRVFFGQFIKGRNLSSEFEILNKFDNFTYKSFGQGRFIKGKPSPEDISLAQNGLQFVKEILESNSYDMIVLDELNGALGCSIVELEQVLELINTYKFIISKENNRKTELIITGRNAPAELIQLSDLVSVIQAEKHYFNAGVPARKGIEL